MSEVEQNGLPTKLEDTEVQQAPTSTEMTTTTSTEEQIQDIRNEAKTTGHEDTANGHEEVTNSEQKTTDENSNINTEQEPVSTNGTESTNGASTNGVANKSNDKLEPEYFRKVFIGSLSYTTTDESLKEYFSKFGELVDCVIMKDSKTQKSRGFGFVTYSKSSMVDELMKNRPHKLDGRELETKRATPREESGKPGAETSTKKLFVGAIKETITEDHLRDYFNKYGKIEDCVVMKDKESNKSRGFGFVTFDDYDPVDKIVLEKFHSISGQSVAVKKALPKELTSQIQMGNNFNSNNNYHMNNHQNNNFKNNQNNMKPNKLKNKQNGNDIPNPKKQKIVNKNNNRSNNYQQNNNYPPNQYNNNNNGYNNRAAYNNNNSYDYNNDSYNNGYDNYSNGNGYQNGNNNNGNNSNGGDMNNQNMANFAMIAQKMLQTAMQMQQNGNGLMPVPPRFENYSNNNGLGSMNNNKRNGMVNQSMPQSQIPPINPALTGFSNNNGNMNQRYNFASDDFDGFDNGFGGPANNNINRMNGNNGVGPVRPMLNNRQMGRVNGGPYHQNGRPRGK